MAVYTWNKRTEYGGKDAPAWKQEYGWDFAGYDNAILEAIPTSGTGTAYRIGFLVAPNSLNLSWGNGVLPKKTSTGYLLQRTAPQQGQLSISGVMVDGAGTPERLYTLQRFSQLMEDKQGDDGVFVTLFDHKLYLEGVIYSGVVQSFSYQKTAGTPYVYSFTIQMAFTGVDFSGEPNVAGQANRITGGGLQIEELPITNKETLLSSASILSDTTMNMYFDSGSDVKTNSDKLREAMKKLDWNEYLNDDGEFEISEDDENFEAYCDVVELMTAAKITAEENNLPEPANPAEAAALLDANTSVTDALNGVNKVIDFDAAMGGTYIREQNRLQAKMDEYTEQVLNMTVKEPEPAENETYQGVGTAYKANGVTQSGEAALKYDKNRLTCTDSVIANLAHNLFWKMSDAAEKRAKADAILNEGAKMVFGGQSKEQTAKNIQTIQDTKAFPSLYYTKKDLAAQLDNE